MLFGTCTVHKISQSNHRHTIKKLKIAFSKIPSPRNCLLVDTGRFAKDAECVMPQELCSVLFYEVGRPTLCVTMKGPKIDSKPIPQKRACIFAKVQLVIANRRSHAHNCIPHLGHSQHQLVCSCWYAVAHSYWDIPLT